MMYRMRTAWHEFRYHHYFFPVFCGLTDDYVFCGRCFRDHANLHYPNLGEWWHHE